MEEQLRQELLRAVMRMLGEEASNKLDMAFTLIFISIMLRANRQN